MESNSKAHRIQRRDFLRLSSGLLLVSGISTLVGCGGSGGGSSSDSEVFRSTKQLSSIGGTITDSERGIALRVPEASLMGATSITLSVKGEPHPLAKREFLTPSPNAVWLTIDPLAISTSRIIEIRIPWTAAYSLLGTPVFVTDPEGKRLMPIDTQYDAAGKALIGSVTREELIAVGATAADPVVFYVGGMPIVEGTRTRSVPINVNSTRNTRITGSGKRVALVLHGINDNAAGMSGVTSVLNNLSVYNGYPLYTDVVAWNYGTLGTLLPIEWNAIDFASYITSTWSNATFIDIYAHSMGGLVSRKAIQLLGPNVANIRQLLTMGTPHLGVPLKAMQLLLQQSFSKEMSLLNFIAPGAFDLIEGSSLLRSLPNSLGRVNAFCTGGISPTLTLGGVPIGLLIDALYGILGLTPDDGIVPLSSALALGQALDGSVKLNHSELVTLANTREYVRLGAGNVGLDIDIK